MHNLVPTFLHRFMLINLAIAISILGPVTTGSLSAQEKTKRPQEKVKLYFPAEQDSDYLRAMTQPSQKLNPAYGYLWWLNGQSQILRAGRGLQPGSLLPDAPKDLIAGQGALGRKVYVVPSQHLVVTRLGDAPGAKFDEQFWKRLMAAAPK